MADITWTPPKTDWKVTYQDGVYTGDFFNASDYNRIKNNLVILHELANALYKDISITDLGDDKAVGDYLYAEELDNIENALHKVNTNTLKLSIGNKTTFSTGSVMAGYKELNRIENACATMYELFQNQYNGRRTFTWNFGIKGGF